MPALTVAQIAELVDGTVRGDRTILIRTANTLESAGVHELAFAESKTLVAEGTTAAGCLIVSAATEVQQLRCAVILVNGDARRAFAKAVTALYARPSQAPSIHPTAVISPEAHVGEGCSIGAYVTIGARTRIGERCDIGPGCHIGDDVEIGPGGTLKPNVSLYDGVRIGSRALIHAGCVLGADGFGFTFVDGRFEKFPQVGRVDIGDDVEIGANTCIDRAALGATQIGSGTKIDNAVHIGHNCNIGKHVAIAAQVGLSGGVTVGDYVMIGGQAGFGEKARVDAKAIIGGAAGVLPGQRIHAGEPVWGVPARPLKQHLRGLAYISKLPQMRDDLRQIRKRLDTTVER